MADESEAERIGFRTSGDWTVVDVALFSSSVAGIYDAFLAFEIRRRLEGQYVRAAERALLRYDKMLSHPIYDELLHLWRQSLQLSRKHGMPWMPPPLPFPLPFGGFGPQLGVLPTPQALYEELDQYAPETDRLRIYRVRLGSPGGFSFAGLGDIVKELRELIKDLWWRNRQERVRGELEIIDKYLSVRANHPELDLPGLSYQPSDRRLSGVVLGHVRNLRLLEERGRLESVAENVDYVPQD